MAFSRQVVAAVMACFLATAVNSKISESSIPLPSWQQAYSLAVGTADMYWTLGGFTSLNETGIYVYGVNLTTQQVQGTASVNIGNGISSLIGLPSGGFIAVLPSQLIGNVYYAFDNYGNQLWSSTDGSWQWPTGYKQATIVGNTAFILSYDLFFCPLNLLTGQIVSSQCIETVNVRVDGAFVAVTVTNSQNVSTTTGYSLPSMTQLWSFTNVSGYLAQNEEYLLLTRGSIFQEGNTVVLVYNSTTLQLINTINAMAGVHTSDFTPRINGDNALFIVDDIVVRAVYLNLLTGAIKYQTFLGLFSLPDGVFVDNNQAFAVLASSVLTVTLLDTGAQILNVSTVPYTSNEAVFAFGNSILVPNLQGYTEWDVATASLAGRDETLPGFAPAAAYAWNGILVYTAGDAIFLLSG